MSNGDYLRDRIVGQRFYDREQDESFTVVGITPAPPLALLQSDDGVGWDETATNFTVDEEVADLMRLDEHGLDSDRYRPLGPGPSIAEICEPTDHEWYPPPDRLWPSGPPQEVREAIRENPVDVYARFVRCKRCGLSGDVAGQFGNYGSASSDFHHPPWFCSKCGDVYPDENLVHVENSTFCSEFHDELEGSGVRCR